jgi:putative membrane protein
MGFHPVYGHYGAGDVLWSIISTALFIGLFVAAIMLLVRMFSGPRQPGVGSTGRPFGVPPWYGPASGSGSGVQPGSVGTGPAGHAPEAQGAERILAERYARGEISEEEYQGRLEVLRRAAPGRENYGRGREPDRIPEEGVSTRNPEHLST